MNSQASVMDGSRSSMISMTIEDEPVDVEDECPARPGSERQEDGHGGTLSDADAAVTRRGGHIAGEARRASRTQVASRGTNSGRRREEPGRGGGAAGRPGRTEGGPAGEGPACICTWACTTDAGEARSATSTAS